jgi:hypothetical protein
VTISIGRLSGRGELAMDFDFGISGLRVKEEKVVASNELRVLLGNLRDRPRMYILSSSYLALASFICGYDCAVRGEVLSGFQSWVAVRMLGHETSVAWPIFIAERRWPNIMTIGVSLGDLPADLDSVTSRDLLDLLEQFLDEKDALLPEDATIR